MTAEPPDLADRKRPRGWFTIHWMMGLTVAVAGVLGMYAPELRSIGRSGGVLLFSFAISVVVFVCFTPVWTTLLFSRERAGGGKTPGRPYYILLSVAYLLSLILLVGTCTATNSYRDAHRKSRRPRPDARGRASATGSRRLHVDQVGDLWTLTPTPSSST